MDILTKYITLGIIIICARLVVSSEYLQTPDQNTIQSEYESSLITPLDSSQDESSAEDEKDSFRDKQAEREGHGSVPLTTRREKRQQAFKNGMKAFLDSFVHIAKLGGPVGHILGVGSTWFKFLLDHLIKKEDKDLWKLLEDNVNIRIGQKLADYHIELLKAQVLNVLNDRISKQVITREDVNRIRDTRHLIYPHNFQKSIGFHYDLVLPVLYWIPFMIDAYQRFLNTTNGKEDCRIANELFEVRKKVVLSSKHMHRLRYRELHGTTDNMNRCPPFEFRPDKEIGKPCRMLTYQDGLSSNNVIAFAANGNLLDGTWSQHAMKLATETQNFLFNEMVDKVNAYFHPKICMTSLGCKCPTKITLNEIYFPWPDKCLGDANCANPCDNFQKSYDYCYRKNSGKTYKEMRCKKINWLKCMPVKVPRIIPPNVIPVTKTRSQKEE